MNRRQLKLIAMLAILTTPAYADTLPARWRGYVYEGCDSWSGKDKLGCEHWVGTHQRFIKEYLRKHPDEGEQ